jgi:hypothetical protein
MKASADRMSKKTKTLFEPQTYAKERTAFVNSAFFEIKHPSLSPAAAKSYSLNNFQQAVDQ